MANQATPYDVVIWLYDLSNGLAKSMSAAFLGKQIDYIPHSGVVVYGTEYFFGGGIAADRPGSTQAGAPVKKFNLGKTNKTQAEFHTWLQSVGDKYTMQTYNILSHNCNNFAAACAEFLLSGVPSAEQFPAEILDLPRVVLATPMGQMFKPMLESMGPNAQGGGPSFVPQATHHLALPTATYNSPPTTAIASAEGLVTSTPIAVNDSVNLKKTFPYNDHRITSLSTLSELPYHIFTQLPVSFPPITHDSAQVTKMFSLVKASYQFQGLKEHFATDRVQKAQDVLAVVVNNLNQHLKSHTITQTNDSTGAHGPIKPEDYIKALNALQIIAAPYETASLIGVLGLYNILFSQLLMTMLLHSQETTLASHFTKTNDDDDDDNNNVSDDESVDNSVGPRVVESTSELQEICKDLLGNVAAAAAADESEESNKESNKESNFDNFVQKLVNLYSKDIIPKITPPSNSTAPKTAPTVLKLMRQGFEQLFFMVLQLSITPSSQLSVLKLAHELIDTNWAILFAQKDNVDDKEVKNDPNCEGLLTLGLELVSYHLSTVKTDYSNRPPKFTPTRSIRTGIDAHNNNHYVVNNSQKRDELFDYITETYVTSVLKLQELFSTGTMTDLSNIENIITSNPVLLRNLKFVNLQIFNVSFITNGSLESCELLLSLDFDAFTTMHQWYRILLNSIKVSGQKSIPDELVQDCIKLLEDFDAIIVLGNRNRF
jgi:hypothetical protein